MQILALFLSSVKLLPEDINCFNICINKKSVAFVWYISIETHTYILILEYDIYVYNTFRLLHTFISMFVDLCFM